MPIFQTRIFLTKNDEMRENNESGNVVEKIGCLKKSLLSKWKISVTYYYIDTTTYRAELI